MSEESLSQAHNCSNRLMTLATELASHGQFAAAEIVAGASLVLMRCVAELTPRSEPKPALVSVPEGG